MTPADHDALRDLLVAEGEAALQRPIAFVKFTGNHEADTLVNDLDGYPHAYLLACLVDRQVPAEWAWSVPAAVRDRLGSFDFDDLVALDEARWVDLMRNPTPAHRLPETMAKVLYLAAQRVASKYDGNAANIWNDTPSSATIVRRFLEFHGAGPKIATMAANILVRDFHVPLRDYRYIDISADSQVQRVMSRLGFVEHGSSTDVVIYAARELNPDFPGIFDLALWDLGRNTCRPTAPLCSSCRLANYCDYAAAHRG